MKATGIEEFPDITVTGTMYHPDGETTKGIFVMQD